MFESQRKTATPELYEGLINRLSQALDVARTAGRLRNEHPVELELCGLSRAELELINAYMNLNEHRAKGRTDTPQAKDAPRSAKIIWLADVAPNRGPEKLRAAKFK